jgi:hypothetical protein
VRPPQWAARAVDRLPTSADARAPAPLDRHMTARRVEGLSHLALEDRLARKPRPVMPAICSWVRIVAGREQHAIDRPPSGLGVVVVPMGIPTTADFLDVLMGAVGWPERRQVLVQDDRRALITGIIVRVR